MPVYKRELLVLNSLISLLDYTEKSEKIDMRIALAVNEMNEELEYHINSMINPKFPIKIHKFPENIGKAKAVNEVVILENYDFDYLISLDSDMICIDKQWLPKMLTTYIGYNREPLVNSSKGIVKLGCLCSNQLGYNVHKCTEKDLAISIYDYTIISSSQNIGVAGGLLMTDIGTWKLLGGYNTSKIYGTDDGYYNVDCYKHNLLSGYLKEVSFYHPYEFNDEYRKWKNDVVFGVTEIVTEAIVPVDSEIPIVAEVKASKKRNPKNKTKRKGI